MYHRNWCIFDRINAVGFDAMHYVHFPGLVGFDKNSLCILITCFLIILFKYLLFLWPGSNFDNYN